MVGNLKIWTVSESGGDYLKGKREVPKEPVKQMRIQQTVKDALATYDPFYMTRTYQKLPKKQNDFSVVTLSYVMKLKDAIVENGEKAETRATQAWKEKDLVNTQYEVPKKDGCRGRERRGG
ncbi:MAG TPA: hypothetical protein ENN60_04085 [archaeon]|nr:hypothetical protein [archaeon]